MDILTFNLMVVRALMNTMEETDIDIVVLTLLLKDSWLSNIFQLPMIMIVLTKKKLVQNSIKVTTTPFVYNKYERTQSRVLNLFTMAATRVLNLHQQYYNHVRGFLVGTNHVDAVADGL